MADEVRRTYENAGIYKIQNKVNGKYYVGSAVDLMNRWSGHKGDLKYNRHDNNRLQNAYNKYGKDNFEFFILEQIKFIDIPKKETEKILLSREQFYIDFLDAANKEKGYNILPIAGSTLGYKNPIAIERKLHLIEIAKNNNQKPTKKHEFYNSLINYTNPNNKSYDPEFDKLIKSLRPDWFVNTSDKTKQQLLLLANRGEPKLIDKHPLTSNLRRYTNPNNKSYDIYFDKEIRDLRPDWFVKTVDENKQKLLSMVDRGEPKPTSKYNLGKALLTYTNPNSECFDETFNEKIRNTWWYTTPKQSDINKQTLLNIASNNERKPLQGKHELGKVLSHYTSPKSRCFDPIFNDEIRKSQWYKNTFE